MSASTHDRDEEEQELIRRARDAGFRRLDELRDRGDVDDSVLEQARENADRMWHSIGFAPELRQSEERGEDAVIINALKDELLAAARDAVVKSRTQSGIDPTIADRVLRRLDARGSAPE